MDNLFFNEVRLGHRQMEAQVARIQAGKVVRVDRVPRSLLIREDQVSQARAATRIGVAVVVVAPCRVAQTPTQRVPREAETVVRAESRR